ncbi:unnamed protein product [Arctogadus glacialis]
MVIKCRGQLAAGTCEIVTLDRDSSQPRRTIARQTARCACKKGQIAGTTRASPACVDARSVSLEAASEPGRFSAEFEQNILNLVGAGQRSLRGQTEAGGSPREEVWFRGIGGHFEGPEMAFRDNMRRKVEL